MADKKDKKKSSSKPAGRLTVGRLSFMIRDLKKIKAEMMPDDEELLGSLDPTNLDDFQKQKALLNKHLGNITQSVSDMNDLKKQRGGARDPELIAMQNENYKMLKQAENMWLKLKDAFEKGAKKKMDPKILEDRRKFVELFGKELMKLQELNSGIKRQPNQDATMQAINKNRERALERANRRAQRRQKREATRKAAGTGGTTEDVEMDEYDKPASAQEQAFFMEVQENDKKMDQLLDVISAGLKELKEIAVDVGTNLDTQKQLLEEVDKKMDETLENYETANARLKQLLDDNTGGIETWCPILILVVVLLAIVGYLFSII